MTGAELKSHTTRRENDNDDNNIIFFVLFCFALKNLRFHPPPLLASLVIWRCGVRTSEVWLNNLVFAVEAMANRLGGFSQWFSWLHIQQHHMCDLSPNNESLRASVNTDRLPLPSAKVNHSDLLKVTRTLSNRWPLTAPTTGQILLHRSMLTWTVVTCNWQKRQKHILKMTEKNLAFEGKDPTEMSGVMDTQRLNIYREATPLYYWLFRPQHAAFGCSSFTSTENIRRCFAPVLARHWLLKVWNISTWPQGDISTLNVKNAFFFPSR